MTSGYQKPDVDNRPADCKAAAAQVEEKLAKVRLLLTGNKVPTAKPKLIRRRPKKEFVEAGIVEHAVVDDQEYEDVHLIPNASDCYCICPASVTDYVLQEIDGCHVKCENDCQKADASQCLQDTTESKEKCAENDVIEVADQNKCEIISSCENKLETIKALLADRKKSRKSKCVNGSETIEIINLNNVTCNNSPIVATDNLKTVNNADVTNIISVTNDNTLDNSELNKDNKQLGVVNNDTVVSKPVEHINNERNNPTKTCVIANGIVDKETLLILGNKNSLCNKRSDIKIPNNAIKISLNALKLTKHKPEVRIVNNILETVKLKHVCLPAKMKYRSNGHIDKPLNAIKIKNIKIATDIPKIRKLDGKLKIKDSTKTDHDSCYASSELLYDQGAELSDFDSDYDSDGQTLTNKLSRTVQDLTDERLYDGSLVRSPRVCSDSEQEDAASSIDEDSVVHLKSVLVDDLKKVERKLLPSKQVSFSSRPPVVHVMRVWTFAARQARAGHWEQHALDRERFKRRIADVDMAISWVLKPQHRARVKFQRFMPWWHAQRRQEAAEKKLRDEEEVKKRLEEENKIIEEDRKIIEEGDNISSQDDDHTKTEDSIVDIVTDLDEDDIKVDKNFKVECDASVL